MHIPTSRIFSLSLALALVIAPCTGTFLYSGAYAMDGGSDRPTSPLEPNAIDRAIECAIDKANEIAETKKELSQAIHWHKLFLEQVIKDEFTIKKLERDLEKERRSPNPDKEKIKKYKGQIKGTKKEIKSNKRGIKKLDKQINKLKKKLRGC